MFASVGIQRQGCVERGVEPRAANVNVVAGSGWAKGSSLSEPVDAIEVDAIEEAWLRRCTAPTPPVSRTSWTC
jgi:hypothetical protein